MVKWSLPAKSDLKQIHDYIATDSRYYAKKVAQTIVEKTEDLSSFPKRGRIVPEIGDASVREIFVYSYRLIYEITPDGIEILGVIHGKSDFLSKITET
jgi:plasmid stabilization system protein ParE